jgi:hypothetical protein
VGVGLQVPFPRSGGSAKSQPVFPCSTAGRFGALGPLLTSSVPVAISVAITVSTLTGCYDSRWGQQKVAQQHNAAAAAPAELRLASRESASEPLPTAPREGLLRVQKVRVRALVTRSFTAQVVVAPRHLRDLFEDANRITEPELGLHLELAETRPWPMVDEDDLVKTFDALRAADAGDGVDWVVGFVGSVPRASRSFHEIGRGALVGKHLLVRAPSSAERHDAIEKSFDELPEEQRRDLEKRLRRHRATVVFLHELGHTLGADHDASPQSIMFPEYNPKVSAFGAASVDVMRTAIAKRNEAPAASAVAARGPVAPASTTTTTAATVAAALSVASTAAPAPVSEPLVPETPELTGAARERFVDAYETAAHGEVAAAWTTLKPLFERYLASMAVQDLRCQLASRTMRFELARRECAPLMKLSTTPSKPQR